MQETGQSLKGFTSNKAYQSSVPFTERRFVSWDGEGDGEAKAYFLFGNSDGNFLAAPDLSTMECLSLIIDKADVDAIHFGFAFGYDVNMILRDLSKNHLQILKDKGSVIWKRWRIEHLPRKWFLVTDRVTSRSVKIWDVWSFFMCSAVKAWNDYKIPVPEIVIQGKAERGLGYDHLEKVQRYWAEENRLYVELVTKLRESLHAAGLFISAWHGPGAIASHSMAKHHINKAMSPPHEELSLASQYAYGGGRFELFKVGRANTKVYEYDINSAYPYAISQLPNLARGHWSAITGPVSRVARFGVYRISWKVNPFEGNNFHAPMPFLHRDKHGQISFPCVNDTWVWSPELAGRLNFPGLVIHEGWEFVEDDETDRPFAWLAENYEKRKAYKAAGNQAQLALKLQMNSMYGKMAQRVGWNEEKRTSPKWHQLEWAGWVVSYCRAMVFRAALHCGSDLVSFETDAVFTTKSIADHLDIGENLGQWEETIYDDFVYLQSGCRFGLKEGDWKEKYRGFDKGSIKLGDVLSVLERNPDEWVVSGKTTRFIGYSQALHTNFATWCEFQTDRDREMHIGGEGKRKHIPKLCRACKDGIPASQTFHDCALSAPVAGQSHKHPLPWKDDELNTPQKAVDEERYTQPRLDD